MKNKDMTNIGFSNYVFSVLKHQQEPSKQDQRSGKEGAENPLVPGQDCSREQPRGCVDNEAAKDNGP